MNFDLIGNTGQVLILMNQNLDYIIGCENRWSQYEISMETKCKAVIKSLTESLSAYN